MKRRIGIESAPVCRGVEHPDTGRDGVHIQIGRARAWTPLYRLYWPRWQLGHSIDETYSLGKELLRAHQDHFCRTVEFLVELHESVPSLDGLFVLPTATKWAGLLSAAERIHLELFLMARGAGCTQTGQFPGLGSACSDPPAWHRSHRSYIGNPSPSVLLVGEYRVHSDEAGLHLAAFLPWTDCGRWLLTSISAHRWRDIGLIGLDDVMGGRLPELWEALGRPRVVALGQLARTVCANYSVPCGTVPHPESAMRLPGLHPGAYGELILRVAHTVDD